MSAIEMYSTIFINVQLCKIIEIVPVSFFGGTVWWYWYGLLKRVNAQPSSSISSRRLGIVGLWVWAVNLSLISLLRQMDAREKQPVGMLCSLRMQIWIVSSNNLQTAVFCSKTLQRHANYCMYLHAASMTILKRSSDMLASQTGFPECSFVTKKAVNETAAYTSWHKSGFLAVAQRVGRVTLLSFFILLFF